MRYYDDDAIRHESFEVGGKEFQLSMWDTGRTDRMGKCILAYRFRMVGDAHTYDITNVFNGEDYSCSPLYAIDSDGSVRGLMSFLTLRAGDVESEYFDEYTPVQIEFRDTYAEDVAIICEERFGEDWIGEVDTDFDA
jgi:hypothetical protein